MAESDHLDKGEILHSLPIMLHEQEELENRLSLVTVRYRDLAAAYEPQIQDLSQRADALAIQFKELYREASEAFAENEKALAKQLSIEGREAQATCEALNRQANEMRTELRNLRDALSVIRQRSRDIRFQIAGLSSRLKTLRTTRVRGFEQSQAVDNIAIERTLDLLPQSVFSEVDIVEYQEEIWQIIGSGKKFSARGRTSWNARDHATIQIARVAVSTTEEPQNEYASVLAHEVGHVVYTKFLSDEERAEWFAISEEASTYLSNYALEDDVEDFAEAFRLFIFSPAILEQKDPKRYSYIKAIDSRMRTIK